MLIVWMLLAITFGVAAFTAVDVMVLRGARRRRPKARRLGDLVFRMELSEQVLPLVGLSVMAAAGLYIWSLL